MREPLTTEEEDLLKDLLKEFDRHSAVVKRLAQSMRTTPREIEDRFDTIWSKLNNGRLIVQNG